MSMGSVLQGVLRCAPQGSSTHTLCWTLSRDCSRSRAGSMLSKLRGLPYESLSFLKVARQRGAQRSTEFLALQSLRFQIFRSSAQVLKVIYTAPPGRVGCCALLQLILDALVWKPRVQSTICLRSNMCIKFLNVHNSTFSLSEHAIV